MRLTKYFLVIAFSVFLFGTLAGCFNKYEFETIEYPGSSSTYATDINDSGQVVGAYAVKDDNYCHSFLLDDGAFTAVDYPGADVTLAKGINELGQIVGVYKEVVHSGNANGFLYDNGTYTSIEYPGAFSTFANGINDSGQIVGEYDLLGTGVGKSFLYENGIYTSIEDPEIDFERAYDINNSGQIIGNFFDQGWMGYLLNGDTPTVIDPPASDFARDALISGINDSGQIVGRYELLNRADWHGFLYDNGTFITINYPGSAFTYTHGINNSGQIVGEYCTAVGWTCSGFIATP